MGNGYKLIDKDGLAQRLEAMRKIQFDAICRNNLVSIYNRTRTMTPVSTELTRPGGPHGELRGSVAINFGRTGQGFFEGEVGYVKDYAPHVEFGHRTRGGGYVPGQRFLQKNVAVQQPIFFREVKEAVKNAK